MSCLLQFLVEVFFYETSEALFLHFVVPDLVRVEVQSATFSLLKAIDQMCQHDSPNVLLNAPEYFFVSTNVAKRFPHLLESVLIRSYRTYWPGELGKKWKFDHPASVRSRFLWNCDSWEQHGSCSISHSLCDPHFNPPESWSHSAVNSKVNSALSAAFARHRVLHVRPILGIDPTLLSAPCPSDWDGTLRLPHSRDRRRK